MAPERSRRTSTGTCSSEAPLSVPRRPACAAPGPSCASLKDLRKQFVRFHNAANRLGFGVFGKAKKPVPPAKRRRPADARSLRRLAHAHAFRDSLSVGFPGFALAQPAPAALSFCCILGSDSASDRWLCPMMPHSCFAIRAPNRASITDVTSASSPRLKSMVASGRRNSRSLGVYLEILRYLGEVPGGKEPENAFLCSLCCHRLETEDAHFHHRS